MKKEEAVQKLLEVLYVLVKVEHISDLANSRRYEEVDAVLDGVDYDLVNKCLHYVAGKDELSLSDIPEIDRLPLAILLTRSYYDDCEIFEDFIEFERDLMQRGVAGALIAQFVMIGGECINRSNSFKRFMEACEYFEE